MAVPLFAFFRKTIKTDTAIVEPSPTGVTLHIHQHQQIGDHSYVKQCFVSLSSSLSASFKLHLHLQLHGQWPWMSLHALVMSSVWSFFLFCTLCLCKRFCHFLILSTLHPLKNLILCKCFSKMVDFDALSLGRCWLLVRTKVVHKEVTQLCTKWCFCGGIV